jgi:iron complex outermembrane receptor protein
MQGLINNAGAMRKRPAAHAIGLIWAGMAICAAASAPAAAQEAGDKPQHVDITGTNIPRADPDTPSPVQIITADDLKKSGYTTVSEVLRNLPANGQGTLSQSFAGAYAAGASGISLRGLTVGATLVLIDGHRMAPYPLSDDAQRSFVDISNIPFDAVERIEILKDGSSAVYGSDAIAGVVNVILKKTSKGTSVTAETGTTQQGGGTTSHAAVMQGFGDLAQDGYTAYVNLEYRHQDAIKVDQRAGQAWTTTDWSPQGGNNLTPGAVNALNGGTPVLRTPYLFNPLGNLNPADPANYAFYPGCSLAAMAANQCTYQNNWAELQPETQNINLIGSLVKNLGADWQLNLKASFFDSQAGVVTGGTPTLNFTSYPGLTAFGPGQPPTQVGAIPYATVPAGYPGNPFGNPAFIYGTINDLGPQRDDVDSRSYRVVADVSGTLGQWDISASLGLTRVTTKQTYHNSIDPSALYNALNSPAQPYLLSGGNSAAANAAIAPVLSSTALDDLDFAELHATRELLQLSGGALMMSGGLGFLHRKLDAEAPAAIAEGQVEGNTAFAVGQQNDGSAYVEFVAPVLKSLEIDVAGRFDHYDTYGNSTTPKVGFRFSPFDAVGLRGTYSRGFRAPNPAESGSGGQAYLGMNTNDPLLCPNGSPTTRGNATQYCDFQPYMVQVSTAPVQPERSRSETLGLILQPVRGWQSTVDYYDIVLRDEIVSAASLDGYVPNYVRGTPQPTTLSNGNGGTTIGTPAYGPILYGVVPYVNANAVETSGVEFETAYRFKLGQYGSLNVDFQITHVLGYEYYIGGKVYELAGTHGPVYVSGDTGNPRNRSQTTFSYDLGAFNATTTFNWIGSYSVTDPSTGTNSTCQQSLKNSTQAFAGATAPSGYCTVGAFLDTDLTLSYKFNKRWTIQAGVLNLFNQAPPIDLQTYSGSGGTAYNPSLHQAGATGRFFNLGANYHF